LHKSLTCGRLARKGCRSLTSMHLAFWAAMWAPTVASAWIASRRYSAAGCDQEALSSENLVSNGDIGTCVDTTPYTTPTRSSSGPTCQGGFVVQNLYLGSAACDEAKLNESFKVTCRQSADGFWLTQICDADPKGWLNISHAWHDLSDCTDPGRDLTWFLSKPDVCFLVGEVYVKASRNGNKITLANFTEPGCPGTGESETEPVGCSCTDEGGCQFVSAKAVVEENVNVEEVSSAFQPSCTLTVLTLLTVGAMEAWLNAGPNIKS